MAFGEADDDFGGMGSSAQTMEPGEVSTTITTMQAVGGSYALHELALRLFIHQCNQQSIS